MSSRRDYGKKTKKVQAFSDGGLVGWTKENIRRADRREAGVDSLRHRGRWPEDVQERSRRRNSDLALEISDTVPRRRKKDDE